MKQLKYFFFLPASIILLVISCSKDAGTTDLVGNWITRASLGGAARSEAVTFTIGDVAYVGTGYDGTDRYYDFRSFNSDANNKFGSWTLLPLPPVALVRSFGIAFSINGKGYVGLGNDQSAKKLKDLWEYTPNASGGTWAQKANFPEPGNVGSGGGTNTDGRVDATAFTLTVGSVQKGFVTCGNNGSYVADLFSFDGTSWKTETSFPGTERQGAVAFVNNNIAYLLTGTNGSKMADDLWAYDPNTAAGGTWTAKRKIINFSTDSYDDDYTDIVRTNAVAFVRNDVNGTPKGYLAAGENGSANAKTWEYDFANDTWTRKTAFEYAAPSGAVSFTLKGRSFVGLGRSGGLPLNTFYEFDPTVAKVDND